MPFAIEDPDGNLDLLLKNPNDINKLLDADSICLLKENKKLAVGIFEKIRQAVFVFTVRTVTFIGSLISIPAAIYLTRNIVNWTSIATSAMSLVSNPYGIAVLGVAGVALIVQLIRSQAFQTFVGMCATKILFGITNAAANAANNWYENDHRRREKNIEDNKGSIKKFITEIYVEMANDLESKLPTCTAAELAELKAKVPKLLDAMNHAHTIYMKHQELHFEMSDILEMSRPLEGALGKINAASSRHLKAAA